METQIHYHPPIWRHRFTNNATSTHYITVILYIWLRTASQTKCQGNTYIGTQNPQALAVT